MGNHRVVPAQLEQTMSALVDQLLVNLAVFDAQMQTLLEFVTVRAHNLLESAVAHTFVAILALTFGELLT